MYVSNVCWEKRKVLSFQLHRPSFIFMIIALVLSDIIKLYTTSLILLCFCIRVWIITSKYVLSTLCPQKAFILSYFRPTKNNFSNHSGNIVIPLSHAAGLYSIQSNTAWSDILTYLSYFSYFELFWKTRSLVYHRLDGTIQDLIQAEWYFRSVFLFLCTFAVFTVPSAILDMWPRTRENEAGVDSC